MKENKVKKVIDKAIETAKSKKTATAEKPAKNKADLVVAIINIGFEDRIVEITNKLGIGGGTIVNAHGLSKFEAEKFFDVVIQPEKSIVLIVANSKKREQLLTELYQTLGPSTDAQGIAFTLPVDDLSENLKNQLFAPKEDKAPSTSKEDK